MNFTNPLAVSNGVENDSIITIIKNTDLFRAEVGGAPLPSNQAVAVKDFPKQLPKGMSEEDMMRKAKQA